jgi:hypothetical protein
VARPVACTITDPAQCDTCRGDDADEPGAQPETPARHPEIMSSKMTDAEYWAMLAEQRAELDDLDTTDANVHAAAVGLTSQLYRNTEAVEYAAHANGPWTDEDMLRHNARATEIARVALMAIRDGADPETALRTMQQSWTDMLPNVEARRLLATATGNAPSHYAEIIERLGLGFMFTHLTHVWAYPRHWWGSLAWAG